MFNCKLAKGIVFSLVMLLVFSVIVVAQETDEIMPGVPRNETLIIHILGGRVSNSDNFNWWTPGTTATQGLQQASLDTLWYMDTDAGVNGIVWDNSLAKDRPIYNEDFTQMTVNLRKGIYWSDGVEFTADDVVYTIQTCMENPQLNGASMYNQYVEEVYKKDDYTVIFKLKKPNSRFHSLFTVRWSAQFIMPEHIFEKVEDPMTFKFNPPVSLGAYVLKDFDPNGKWYLWERREDWERTTIARYGKPAPKYLYYKAFSDTSKMVMAQSRHELDLMSDISPEGLFSVMRENPYSESWFEGIPWGHPDPTLAAVLLNHDKRYLGNKDVRWALTLITDVVDVALASMNGGFVLSPIQMPPTGNHPEQYFEPIQDWLEDFTLEVDGEEFYPYNPSVPLELAKKTRETLSSDVPLNLPEDPDEIKDRLGMGWWKYAPEIAEKLLIRNGFSRNENGDWLQPDGERWEIAIKVEGPSRPTLTRAGTEIAEQWSDFGIGASTEVDNLIWTSTNWGRYEAALGWNIETWGGHPDLSFFLSDFNSDLIVESGQPCNSSNNIRYENKEVDELIKEMEKTKFSNREDIKEIGENWIKITTKDMITIPLTSWNNFTVHDTYYWENFPTHKNPYTNHIDSFANNKFMFTQLEPSGR